MPRSRTPTGQLPLFTSAAALTSALDLSAAHALASRVPPHVRFGTSSWTFPGWAGIVYPGEPTERELVDRGLAAYATYPLFRTVGIDRSYYAPLRAEELATYAAQLPDGFRCVQKVWRGITSREDPFTGRRQPFLDATMFEDLVLGPNADAFAAHVGPLVLEFAPMRGRDRPTPDRFAAMLDGFFAAVPKRFPYAVELRNPELLSPPYLDVLRAHGVAHVLNLWERMPDIGEQLAIDGVFTAPFVVARLLIAPGRRYSDAKAQFAPFNRLVAIDEKMRADVAALVRACEAQRKDVWIVVNNKVEGSAPLTVGALVERVANPG